jgi:hypothetical protein
MLFHASGHSPPLEVNDVRNSRENNCQCHKGVFKAGQEYEREPKRNTINLQHVNLAFAGDPGCVRRKFKTLQAVCAVDTDE